MDDATLLKQFRAGRSEAAFAEIVRRNVDLVYAAARRQARGNAALAEDVTQGVFARLAEKAHSIRDGEALAGWLLVTTRFVALNAIRSEARRRRHEREAAVMNLEQRDDQTTAQWREIGPVLDEAIARLKTEDRDALALRYFQGRSVADVAAALGVSTEAAQKRVNRAVDRLRELFARRGITTSADALSAALLANAVVAAPAALGTSVAGTALVAGANAANAASGVGAVAGKGMVAIMAAINGKVAAVAVVAVVVVGVTGTIAYQHIATPSGKPRQVKVDAASTVAPPAGDFDVAALTRNPNWRAVFDQRYALQPGEVIKRVAPPFIPERLDFYLNTVGRGQAEAIPRGADAIILHQAGSSPAGHTWRFGGAFDVGDLLRSVAGVSPQEVDLPVEVKRRELPGDWVVRGGAPVEQRMAALATLISRATTRPIAPLVRTPRERDVIVVGGTYAYRPLASGTTRPQRGQMVHLFVGDLESGRNRGGGGAGLENAFERVSDLTGYPIVYDTSLKARASVSYHHHPSLAAFEEARRTADVAPAPLVDELLANLAKQTSLTITRERRTIPIWEPATSPTTAPAN